MHKVPGLVAALAASIATPAFGSDALIRFPNGDGRTIVFSARGHIWRVPATGGRARPVTSGSGYEIAPRFSPDGRWIAFTGDRGGQQDVYVVSAGGGAPMRLTWSTVAAPWFGMRRASQESLVVAWTPDSRSVVFLSRRRSANGQFRPFAVPVAGGPATPLPVDRSGYLSFSPDGRRLAMNRNFTDFANWKRYTGGLQQDVELYDPATRSLQRVAPWKGNDGAPMWVGDRIYFLSDRDDHRRVNLWVHDLKTNATREVTRFTDYDVDIPSYGGGSIAFQQAGRLWSLDVATGRLRRVPVDVPDDGSRTAPRRVPLRDAVREEDTDYDTDFRLSPDGDHAVLSARGRLFTVATASGATRDLTGAAPVEEDHPEWSPDGRRLAFTTDVDGEQQLAVRPADGGPARPLTRFRSGFFFQPVWSPDGGHVAIDDGAHRLWLVPTDGGSPKAIAYDRDHYMHETNEHDAAFSPDGRWLAYSLSRPTRLRALHLYEVATGRDFEVSSPMESDYRPSFSPDGRYLFFVSDRHAIAVQSDRETNAVTVKSAGIYAAALAAGDAPPLQPVPEGRPPPVETAGAKAPVPIAAKTADAPAVPPMTPTPTPAGPARSGPVDPTGLMARAVPVPVAPSNIRWIKAADGGVVYLTAPPDTLDGALPGERTEVRRYDLASSRDELVASDVDAATPSADGRRLLLKRRGDWLVVDAAAGAPRHRELDLSGVQATVEPRAEWREMFANVWRLERDLFVNSDMNLVDWAAVRARYAKLLPLVATRDDLNYLIGQMIGELGSSHTYVGGGDDGQTPSTKPTPRLGADLVPDPASGRYRFERNFAGDSTRPELRGPLGWPGVEVSVGDFLLAVDGRELVAPTTPEELLEGKSGAVRLTVAPAPDGPRRVVDVAPIASETAVRRLAWQRRSAAIVEKLSEGRVGYVPVSDMQAAGMRDFVRGFYPQLGKEGLIVDDRWNGGGNTDQIILERLRRELSSMQTLRDRVPQTQPDQVQVGPKDMLINQNSASDGDVFPFHFRAYGLGRLVGTRTWGGVRGIRTFWTLKDGGFVTIPEITFSTLAGEWMLENVGNVPDVEVDDQPWEDAADRDRQLEAAVADVMSRLPSRRPPPPLPPDVPIYAPAR